MQEAVMIALLTRQIWKKDIVLRSIPDQISSVGLLMEHVSITSLATSSLS